MEMHRRRIMHKTESRSIAALVRVAIGETPAAP